MNPATLALIQAVKLAGGQTQMARKLKKTGLEKARNLKQGQVWNWINRDKQAPPHFAIPIEEIVNGVVKRYQLRPDVFPPEESA